MVTTEDCNKALEVVAEQYYTFPGTSVTVCCLTLESGFSLVGISASRDSKQVDIEISKKTAKDNAWRDGADQIENFMLRMHHRTDSNTFR